MLILSNERDISVDWVVRLLRARGISFTRINTERLLDCTLDVRPLDRQIILHRDGDSVDLSEVTSVWYRRPDPPQMPKLAMSPGEAGVVRAQWRMALRGFVHVLHARWINHPDHNDAAEQKILQLRTAAEMGLNVPATVVTSDRGTVLDFARQHEGRVVLKGLDAPYVEDKDGSDRFVFTTRLADAPPTLDGLEQAPMVVQREIRCSTAS